MVHSNIIDSRLNWSKPIIKNDIYTNFVKSFQGFEKVVGWVIMDGSWIGVVVDFECELLTRYAEEADAEILANPF